MKPRNVLFEKALSMMNADQRYRLDDDIKAYFQSVGAHKSRFIRDGRILQTIETDHKLIALGALVCINQKQYPVVQINRFTMEDNDGFLTFIEDYSLGDPL